MEKKDKHEEEPKSGPGQNPGGNVLREPAIQYGRQEETEMAFSPPLTEDELKNAITGDELLDYILKKIDKLPGK